MGLSRNARPGHKGFHEVPLAERLFRSMKRDPITGCWLWQLQVESTGYGRIKVDGRKRAVHRVAYELLVEPVPEGLHLDHLCKVRHCLNPAHLEPVTPVENILRSDGFAALNARKTACVRGHEFTPENTTISGGKWPGRRICLACGRESQRAYRARKAAA